jgi:hypothetical protein
MPETEYLIQNLFKSGTQGVSLTLEISKISDLSLRILTGGSNVVKTRGFGLVSGQNDPQDFMASEHPDTGAIT